MEQVQHPIKKVTAFVLTEWGMMLVEPLDSSPEEVFDADESCFTVSAQYRGVFDGQLTIICQSGFLDTLAANILGAEPPIAQTDQWDALRELANIISGNFLVEEYGAETVFDLPAFVLDELDFEAARVHMQAKPLKYLTDARALFLADGEPVFVSFDIHAAGD